MLQNVTIDALAKLSNPLHRRQQQQLRVLTLVICLCFSVTPSESSSAPSRRRPRRLPVAGPSLPDLTASPEPRAVPCFPNTARAIATRSSETTSERVQRYFFFLPPARPEPLRFAPAQKTVTSLDKSIISERSTQEYIGCVVVTTVGVWVGRGYSGGERGAGRGGGGALRARQQASWGLPSFVQGPPGTAPAQ